MVDWRVTRWGEDPFSCGAYSYMRVGSAPADVHALAAPEHGGRVHFAGEACSWEAGPSYRSLCTSTASTFGG